MLPRDHFKTSIKIGSTLQRILTEPKEILFANSTATAAQRDNRKVQKICEMNKILQWAFPDVIPQTFDKVRWCEEATEFLNGSIIDTIGVGGKITGWHGDIIEADDLIEKEAAESDVELESIFKWFLLMEDLLKDPVRTSEIHLTGTRWTAKSIEIYYQILNSEKYAEYEVLLRSALEDKEGNPSLDGEPIFSERFTRQFFLDKRAKNPYLFSCQQMNDPINPEMTDFDPNWVKYYHVRPDGRLVLRHSDDDFTTYSPDTLRITATCDPAIGTEKKHSRSAITVLGVAPRGEKILLESWADRVNPKVLLDKMFQVQQRWQPVEFGIEAIAFQKAFRYYYEERRRREGTYIRWIELKPGSRAAKEKRILGIQPYIQDGSFYIQEGMTNFIDEFTRFPLGDTDDLLDALAYQIQLWRLPVTREDRLAEQRALESFRGRVNPITGY